MHRIVLLIAALTPLAPQTYPTGFTKNKTEATTAIAMPPIVFRNNIEAVTRKPGRTIKGKGSMLYHIYDSYAASSRHYHIRSNGPSFDKAFNKNTTIEADTGATVNFDCHVILLRNKTVSWLKTTKDEMLELLTIDIVTHTSDTRFRVKIAGDNWRLVLSNAKVQDSGIYCCQVSTHPPLVRRIKLTVHPPEIEMIKEAFLETSETLSLKCMVLHLYPGNTPILRWYRGNSAVSIDEMRGGVMIETDYLNLTTHLQVARLKIEDAGNYTCALRSPLQMNIVARVHVLQGSSLGELHSGAKTTTGYLSLMLASVQVVFGK